MVMGDHDRLVQVMVNLLSNAIKFSYAHQEVRVRVTGGADGGEDGMVVVQVEDAGRGVSKEQLSRLGRRFAQVGGPKTQGQGEYASRGVGLGLVVSRSIVEGHRGQLTLLSEGLNCGATAVLKLPLWSKVECTEEEMRALQEEKLPSRELVPGVGLDDGNGNGNGNGGLRDSSSDAGLVGGQKSGSWDGPGLCALVVDDTVVNLKIVSRLLGRMAGVERVLQATSGEDALQVLRENEGVDIIFMDVYMPGMDGPETARKIRAAERTAHIPIYALTASASQGVERQCLEAGMVSVLVKPVTSATLAVVIDKAIQNRPV